MGIKEKIEQFKQQRTEEAAHQKQVREISTQRRRDEEIRNAQKRRYEPKEQRGPINRTLDFVDRMGAAGSSMQKARTSGQVRSRQSSRQRMRNNQRVVYVNQQVQPQQQSPPRQAFDNRFSELFSIQPKSFGMNQGRNYSTLFSGTSGKKKKSQMW